MKNGQRHYFADRQTIFIRLAMAVFIGVTLAGSWTVAGWLVPATHSTNSLFQLFMFLPANIMVLAAVAVVLWFCLWLAIYSARILTKTRATWLARLLRFGGDKMKYALFCLVAAFLAGFAIRTAWPSMPVAAFLALGLSAGGLGVALDSRKTRLTNQAK